MILHQLKILVGRLGHRVAGMATTEKQAVAEARNKSIDLILSDVHLADDSSGIDAAESILKLQEVPVIFITAYPERLLTGSCAEPAFLITKPFTDDEVQASIDQALYLESAKRSLLDKKSRVTELMQ
jgi:CheY-like chemotaxis protein